jgi:hypothetical protein
MKSQAGREVLNTEFAVNTPRNYTLLDAVKLTKQSKGFLVIRNPIKRNQKNIEFFEVKH